MEDFFHWLQQLGDKVFTEAGIVALILFWLSIYLMWDNRSLRKQKDSELNQKHNQIFEMGTKQIEANVNTNTLLDKMVSAVDGLTHLLERAGILKDDRNKP